MFPKCVGVLTMYVYYQRFLRVILTWVTVFFPTLLIVHREAIPSVPFFVWIKRIRILPLHSRLLSLAASLWVILDGSASLFPFKHTRPWIFSSALRQEPVRTSLWGHPGGHWGANQASGQGSLVIIMQGIFSLPSTEERQRDTGHRLLTHSWQLFALSDFKPAALKKKKSWYTSECHMTRAAGESGYGKGNLVILTLTAKAYLKWKCHPFSSHHCVDGGFVDISESNCHHVGISRREKIQQKPKVAMCLNINKAWRVFTVLLWCHPKSQAISLQWWSLFLVSFSQNIHCLDRRHVVY